MTDFVLDLQRMPSDDEATISRLFIDGVPTVWILEDVVRPVKIPGETAIPAGTYQVIVTHSPRFNRPLPLLVDVPGFDGVRIHPGNTAADTHGCLLPGLMRSGDTVTQSRAAFDLLYAKIQAAIERGEKVSIRITDAQPVPVADRAA